MPDKAKTVWTDKETIKLDNQFAAKCLLPRKSSQITENYKQKKKRKSFKYGNACFEWE